MFRLQVTSKNRRTGYQIAECHVEKNVLFGLDKDYLVHSPIVSQYYLQVQSNLKISLKKEGILGCYKEGKP
jgi:hypothetical protein